MTDLLKDALRQQAEAQAPPVIDAAEIIRAGDRRVRRSRLATGLAAAGVVAAVAAGSTIVSQILDHPTNDSRKTQAAATPAPQFTERRVGFSAHGVIHWGAESFEVGATVTSYVQTDDGFVYTTRNGDVRLFDGKASERVGHAAYARLRADDTGSLVAWVGSTEAGQPQYVVYDTAARKEVARVDDEAAGPSRESWDLGTEVFAVDDGAAYWRNAEGLVRYDVATGKTEVLSHTEPVTDPVHKPAQVTDVVDVAAGRIAYVEDDEGSRLLVGEGIGDSARQVKPLPEGQSVLSPDGRYLGVEGDEVAVHDITTGEDVTPVLDGYGHRAAYGWVDDDTAMVLAVKGVKGERFSVDFLACDVPDGVCEVVSSAEVGQFGIALPFGDPRDT